MQNISWEIGELQTACCTLCVLVQVMIPSLSYHLKPLSLITIAELDQLW